MSYVIFNAETRRTVKEAFPTERGAKIAASRMMKKNPELILEVADAAWYHQNVNIMVERVNLLSGQKYMEPINTPSYCSPASESYWSMWLLFFSSDLFVYQPVLGILETNLSTLALDSNQTLNSLKELKEFTIISITTGRRMVYRNANYSEYSNESDMDIMRNHNGAYIMRIFVPVDKSYPKTLVWDGRDYECKYNYY